jgi:hypothetical protein
MSDRIEHSREEWHRINAERRKVEAESYAKRKAREEVPDSAETKWIVRNLYGIHPDDEPTVVPVRSAELPPRGIMTRGARGNRVFWGGRQRKTLASW